MGPQALQPNAVLLVCCVSSTPPTAVPCVGSLEGAMLLTLWSGTEQRRRARRAANDSLLYGDAVLCCGCVVPSVLPLHWAASTAA